MTKRILALLLALALVFTLASCGKKKDEEQPDDKKDNDTEATDGDNTDKPDEGNKGDPDEGQGITVSDGEGTAEDIDWNDFEDVE